METINASVVLTNFAAVLSCFSIYLCLPNPYHKALDEIWTFLDAENRAYYEPLRVQFQNPAANGLSHIDVLVRRSPDVSDSNSNVKRKTAAATAGAKDDDGEETANTIEEDEEDNASTDRDSGKGKNKAKARNLEKPDSLQSLQDSDSQTALLSGAGDGKRRIKKHK